MIYGPDTKLQGEIMMPFSEPTSFYSDCCFGYSNDRKSKRQGKAGNHLKWICTKNKSSFTYMYICTHTHICILLDMQPWHTQKGEILRNTAHAHWNVTAIFQTAVKKHVQSNLLRGKSVQEPWLVGGFKYKWIEYDF